MKDLKYRNLLENKCPDCRKDWAKMGNATFHDYGVIECKCGFKISEKKMKEHVNALVNNRLDKELQQ